MGFWRFLVDFSWIFASGKPRQILLSKKPLTTVRWGVESVARGFFCLGDGWVYLVSFSKGCFDICLFEGCLFLFVLLLV